MRYEWNGRQNSCPLVRQGHSICMGALIKVVFPLWDSKYVSAIFAPYIAGLVCDLQVIIIKIIYYYVETEIH